MKHSPCFFRRLWLLILFPIGGIFSLVAAYHQDFAEWYARYPYHWLSLAINRVTGPFPFSLAEILLYLLIAAILFWLVFSIVQLIRKPDHRGKRLVRFLMTPLCAASVVFFLFVFGSDVYFVGLRAGPLEIADGLAKPAADLGEFLGTENKHYYNEN